METQAHLEDLDLRVNQAKMVKMVQQDPKGVVAQRYQF